MKFLLLCRAGALAALLTFATRASGQSIKLPPMDPPNEIAISAQVPKAYAAAGTTGSFRVQRTGSALNGVTIYYQVSGQAVPGQDYTALKGTRTIDASKDHVLITVHPLVVPGSAGTVKGVRVTLLPGEGYSLGLMTKATVKIVQ